jgi:hypothetical protein
MTSRHFFKCKHYIKLISEFTDKCVKNISFSYKFIKFNLYKDKQDVIRSESMDKSGKNWTVLSYTSVSLGTRESSEKNN